jgi:response regulator of citrate/malate metabolism
MHDKSIEILLQGLNILIVDANHYMRRLTRTMLIEALRSGVHEFLLKPTSPKALRDRLTAIAVNPRPMMRIGKHYVPEPRRAVAAFGIEGAA